MLKNYLEKIIVIIYKIKGNYRNCKFIYNVFTEENVIVYFSAFVYHIVLIAAIVL